MVGVRMLWAGVIGAALVAAMTPVFAEEEAATSEVRLAALPITPAISTPATEGPVIQVQTQTCGCTPPPNRKQKIMTNNSGKLTCTVTTLACWAP
jgi:hypothetical protein